MFFYIATLSLLLFCSLGGYTKLKSNFSLIILLLLISLKGEVGPDYYGYLHRYEIFNPAISLLKSNGEFSWYLIELITYLNKWDYQMYTVITAFIGVGFMTMVQNKIKYLGFFVFTFQLFFVQLGLSGMRQFIAACILIYAVTIYLFENQKSIYKFIFLILLAASFHISALVMTFVLPFLVSLNKKQIFLLLILLLIGVSTQVLDNNIDRYDTRYLQGSSYSSGAWFRFAITAIVIKLGLVKSNKNVYYLGLSILVFGLISGLVNSIALHRFNYYLFPIACLILIANKKSYFVSSNKIRYLYFISIFYFLVWFSLSKYADSFIPYSFFFN